MGPLEPIPHPHTQGTMCCTYPHPDPDPVSNLLGRSQAGGGAAPWDLTSLEVASEPSRPSGL